MLGVVIGLAGAAVGVGIGLLGAGAGVLLSDVRSKHHVRPLRP